MKQKIVVLGGGGHAKVAISTARACGLEIWGVVDGQTTEPVLGAPILGPDSFLYDQNPKDIVLVNGIGNAGALKVRERLYSEFVERGFRFLTLIHPSAFVAAEAVIDEGAQVLAGATVQAHAKVQSNSIVNTGASVDHDCVIGRHSHIAPGATLCGGSHVGERTLIGAGAVLVPGIKVGGGCSIGAGSVVLKNVEDGVTAYGNPAHDRK